MPDTVVVKNPFSFALKVFPLTPSRQWRPKGTVNPVKSANEMTGCNLEDGNWSEESYAYAFCLGLAHSKVCGEVAVVASRWTSAEIWCLDLWSIPASNRCSFQYPLPQSGEDCFWGYIIGRTWPINALARLKYEFECINPKIRYDALEATSRYYLSRKNERDIRLILP